MPKTLLKSESLQTVQAALRKAKTADQVKAIARKVRELGNKQS